MAHKHLAHKQFLGHPGHRSSRPGTRFLPARYPDENIYVPWVPHTAHQLLTPGHRSGDPPPPPGRETPPPRPGSHQGNLFVFMCLFLVLPLHMKIRPTFSVYGWGRLQNFGDVADFPRELCDPWKYNKLHEIPMHLRRAP